MQFKPKVSIVIPVYNGSNYMREAIDSALAQTYQNIEVIVVNDGSDDDGKTEEIAMSYGDKIRYFYKDNGGVASALNLGIREMTGDWFAWLSHDDKFSENRIDSDVRTVMGNMDIKVTYCNLSKIDSQGTVIKENSYVLNKITNPREALTLGGPSMCSMTINRSCFDKVGMFNESNKTTQDTEMSLLLSRSYHLYFSDGATIFSREHPQRDTYTQKSQHKKDRIVLANFVKENFSIEDFLDGRKIASKSELENVWCWLGDLYSFLGAYEYADECYKIGFNVQRQLFSKVWAKNFIGARALNNPLLKGVSAFFCRGFYRRYSG